VSILDHQVNDTIKRVETKTCFKYPEREYLRGANLNDTIKRAKTKDKAQNELTTDD
jgi:2-C-methyl-D-erythritol 4-phosphate cytidylyltransferase